MITIKTPAEIQIIREGGKILEGIMKELESRVVPGITTGEIDRLAESLIFKFGGSCSFKGHGGFPACLCISLNNEIVHGVPSGRIIKDGDIVSLDLGIFYKDFHTDMAKTFSVGSVDKRTQKLIEVTGKSLEIGIRNSIIGNTFGDVGNEIQKYVESNGFNVVRDLCGHGIGKDLHEDPQILNYGKRGSGVRIKEGMVFCLEPMVTAGDWRIKNGKDGFAYETKDGSLSAHFEATIAATKEGVLVLAGP